MHTTFSTEKLYIYIYAEAQGMSNVFDNEFLMIIIT